MVGAVGSGERSRQTVEEGEAAGRCWGSVQEVSPLKPHYLYLYIVLYCN